jgi:hypothetical protein
MRVTIKEFDREQVAPTSARPPSGGDAAPPQTTEPVRPERTLFELEP